MQERGSRCKSEDRGARVRIEVQERGLRCKSED